MERGLILLTAALMVSVVPGVQGTSHLSFANNTGVNITGAGCGTSKLCVEKPDDCAPAGNSRCLFTSVVVSNTNVLSIQLSGASKGFIAMGLAREDTSMLFICGRNNSEFFFQTKDGNNTGGELKDNERNVTEIRGKLEDDTIQCEFDIPDVNSSNARSSHGGHPLLYSILLATGNGTVSGSLENTKITGVLDLTKPEGEAQTTTTSSGSSGTGQHDATTGSPNITATPTGSGSKGAVQLPAVLLLLSVLVLSITLRA